MRKVRPRHVSVRSQLRRLQGLECGRMPVLCHSQDCRCDHDCESLGGGWGEMLRC